MAFLMRWREGDVLRIDDPALRRKLRIPLGRLFGDFDEALRKARAARKSGLLVVSVGDRTTYNFIKRGFIPDLALIDGREMRLRGPEVNKSVFIRRFAVKNPKGCINLSIEGKLREAVKKGPSLVEVRGEEDLLTLLVILTAPLGSAVFYGQPGKGVVMVLVNEGIRRVVRRFLSSAAKSGKS